MDRPKDSLLADLAIGLIAGLVATKMYGIAQEALAQPVPQGIKEHEEQLRPEPTSRVAARKIVEGLGYHLDEQRLKLAAMTVHYGLGLAWGPVYGLLRWVWANAPARGRLEAVGRDLTFTGRTTIWTHAIDAGMQHSMLGAGYRAFWTPEGASYVYARIWAVIGNGHNGYLDVWLELGFIGLGLFLLMFFTAAGFAWWASRRHAATAAVA